MGILIEEKSVRTSLNKAIGKEIYSIRKQCNLSGRDLAKILNVSQQQVSRYECGVCKVTIDTLIIILNIFDMSLADFFQRVYLSLNSQEERLSRHYKSVFENSELNENIIKAGIESYF